MNGSNRMRRGHVNQAELAAEVADDGGVVEHQQLPDALSVAALAQVDCLQQVTEVQVPKRDAALAPRHQERLGDHSQTGPTTHLLFDPGAAVPDTDEVIQSRANDTRGGADQRGDIPTMTVNMADTTPCQDVPQADGAVLPTARQNHRLRRPKHSHSSYIFPVFVPTTILCYPDSVVLAAGDDPPGGGSQHRDWLLVEGGMLPRPGAPGGGYIIQFSPFIFFKNRHRPFSFSFEMKHSVTLASLTSVLQKTQRFVYLNSEEIQRPLKGEYSWLGNCPHPISSWLKDMISFLSLENIKVALRGVIYRCSSQQLLDFLSAPWPRQSFPSLPSPASPLWRLCLGLGRRLNPLNWVFSGAELLTAARMRLRKERGTLHQTSKVKAFPGRGAEVGGGLGGEVGVNERGEIGLVEPKHSVSPAPLTPSQPSRCSQQPLLLLRLSLRRKQSTVGSLQGTHKYRESY
ncbi:hypothetical protein FQN60_017290 [Etheostoma spectabile]|uniref:Uncharacterized protein n=1 Tax=Etheostoma spectabile TaxID=54343 RepID=A0A5J5DF30_9PERO|nr:hypothetical protein FQN60_017290 [Etheostoma spectabile]